jgi:hypothetical protein
LTAHLASGERIDATRLVSERCAPPFVQLSPEGRVRALAEGEGERAVAAGWAILPRTGVRHEAVFEARDDVCFTGGALIYRRFVAEHPKLAAAIQLGAAQYLAWALIDSPEFLFNR